MRVFSSSASLCDGSSTWPRSSTMPFTTVTSTSPFGASASRKISVSTLLLSVLSSPGALSPPVALCCAFAATPLACAPADCAAPVTPPAPSRVKRPALSAASLRRRLPDCWSRKYAAAAPIPAPATNVVILDTWSSPHDWVVAVLSPAYPMRARGSVAFMQANDITRDRLRRLAEADVGGAKVLSLFLNLDPREFATPPARSTEVRSLLDRAGRLVQKEAERLDHQQKESLRADLERVQAEIGNGAGTKGAHGLAVFSCSAAGLFEVLRLSEAVDHEPVISDTPYLAPLSSVDQGEQWCVVLVNRRSARLLCGSRDALEELALVEDDVHGQHEQGGWSQARYQRSVDKGVQDHLKHVAEVVFLHMKNDLPQGVIVGGPQETVTDFEAALHPYLRERLAGRIDIDVENSAIEDVRRMAGEKIAAAAREREDQALSRLAELFGSNGRAASGLDDVLGAVHEQRVEVLLVDRGFTAPGVCCPQCGFLGGAEITTCPADGTRVEPRDNVVEAAIERAITQSADVQILRDRPELASHGHVAAILRF